MSERSKSTENNAASSAMVSSLQGMAALQGARDLQRGYEKNQLDFKRVNEQHDEVIKSKQAVEREATGYATELRIYKEKYQQVKPILDQLIEKEKLILAHKDSLQESVKKTSLASCRLKFAEEDILATITNLHQELQEVEAHVKSSNIREHLKNSLHRSLTVASEISNYASRHKSLEKAVEEANKHEATSEYTIEGINETIEDNAKREQELSDKLGESKRLLVELRTASDELREKEKEEAGKLIGQRESQHAKREQYSDETSQLKQKFAKAVSYREEKVLEKERIELALEDLQAEKRIEVIQAREAETELCQLEKEIEEIQDKLQKMLDMESSHKEELGKFEKKYNGESKENLKILKHEKQKLREMKGTLASVSKMARDKFDELCKLSGKVTTAESELDTMMQELESYEASEDNIAEIRSMGTNIRSIRSETENLEAEMEGAQEELQRLQNHEALSKAAKSKGMHQGRAKSKTSQVEELRKKHEKKLAQKEEMDQQIILQNQKLLDLKEKNQEHRKSIRTLDIKKSKKKSSEEKKRQQILKATKDKLEKQMESEKERYEKQLHSEEQAQRKEIMKRKQKIERNLKQLDEL